MPDAAIERDADGEYRWSRYGQLVIILLETIIIELCRSQLTRFPSRRYQERGAFCLGGRNESISRRKFCLQR